MDTKETTDNVEKEAARGRRRRAAHVLQKAIEQFNADEITAEEFNSIFLGIPTETLDAITYHGRKYPDRADDGLIETIREYSTCLVCEDEFAAAGVVLILYDDDNVDVYCQGCYAAKRHELHV